MSDSYQPGLEGVIASETSISYLDVEHEEIVIRGYDLIELAKQVTYLDLVGLLLDDALPTPQAKFELEGALKAAYPFPQEVFTMLRALPKTTNMMDVLRTGISILAAFDEDLDDLGADANRRKAIRLISRVPQIVSNGYRVLHDLPVLPPRTDLGFTANFLYMITGNTPTETQARIFDQSLMAYSEHEMPNSTFTARVIASTNSDIYAALTGSVASLKGTLHGGANEAVMKMLLEAGSVHGVESLIREKLSRRERIMGFGHRVYMKKYDPRALLMKEALAKLATDPQGSELYEMCLIGEKVMREEKGLFPNLDYYAAPVYYLLGIPIDLFTPVFLAARTVGVCAHVIEQHSHNRLFRPRVLYTGARGLHP